MIAPKKIHLTTTDWHESFADCIAVCKNGLEALGYDVKYEPSSLSKDGINILFYSLGQSWTELSRISSKIIIYNWEPCIHESNRFPPNQIRKMLNTHVWDYSASNVNLLKKAGVQDVHHVPFGFSENMVRIEKAAIQDIDVLFYGQTSRRRRHIFNKIRETGLNLVTTDDVGRLRGQERDAYIARSKVVLGINMFEQSKTFDIARVAYLLSNSKAVVTELSDKSDIEEDLRSALVYGSETDLPQLCWDLVHDNERRHALEKRAFEIFSKRNQVDIMRTAMNRYFQQFESTPSFIGNQPNISTPLPKTLNIGAGTQWRFDCCNIDIRADFAPDLCINLSKPIDPYLGQKQNSWRFGEAVIEAGYFSKILARNIFQRVEDIEICLTNCLTLLENGGILELTVPLDLSYDAWMDTDDKRAFNDRTWKRIIDDWWRYKWLTHRFEIISSSVGYNNQLAVALLAETNNDWEQVSRTPRMIDMQNLTLRKRLLNDDEKLLLPQTRFLD